MEVLADRVLELGPKPLTDGPYRNFKLTRDSEGIAWLLFDRAGASANTLSAECHRGTRLRACGAGSRAACGSCRSLRQELAALSLAPMLTNFAAQPIPAWSKRR